MRPYITRVYRRTADNKVSAATHYTYWHDESGNRLDTPEVWIVPCAIQAGTFNNAKMAYLFD